jgi:hypothetical protein
LNGQCLRIVEFASKRFKSNRFHSKI